MRISDWSSDVCSSDLDSDFAGKYRLVYFGYSFCPDICPVDLQKLMRGLSQFEKTDAARGAKVAPLFITVDPERDTSEALKPFVERYHPRLLGLTGTPEQLARVAKALDRKSVGLGKSVSVRVDLGGRRYIKKKNK